MACQAVCRIASTQALRPPHVAALAPGNVRAAPTLPICLFLPVTMPVCLLVYVCACVRPPPHPLQASAAYMRKLLQALQFMWHQAVGLPSGPHAAFKGYMVDAATARLVRQVRAVRRAAAGPEASSVVALFLQLNPGIQHEP